MRSSRQQQRMTLLLEVLETRTMLSGTPVPTPVPAPAPTSAPAVSNSNTTGLDLVKLAFDGTKTVADSTILANLAILATGRIPPPQMLEAGAAAESVNLALLAPTLASDLWTYGQDLANGKYLKAANDLATLFGDVRGGLLPTAASVTNDLNSFSEDWSKLFPSVTQPSIPAPAPNPAPTPTPTPTPVPVPAPTPSSVGTYSATLVPTGWDGDVGPNTPQNVSLTLNANGSGSLSVSPFAGTPLTVNFPAETAALDADGSVEILDYDSPTGYQINVGASLSGSGNALEGDFDVLGSRANNYDTSYFDNATLNRQA